MSTAAELRWAELLGELRLLRELGERQVELLSAILGAEEAVADKIRRAGLA